MQVSTMVLLKIKSNWTEVTTPYHLVSRDKKMEEVTHKLSQTNKNPSRLLNMKLRNSEPEISTPQKVRELQDRTDLGPHQGYFYKTLTIDVLKMFLLLEKLNKKTRIWGFIHVQHSHVAL